MWRPKAGLVQDQWPLSSSLPELSYTGTIPLGAEPHFHVNYVKGICALKGALQLHQWLCPGVEWLPNSILWHLSQGCGCHRHEKLPQAVEPWSYRILAFYLTISLPQRTFFFTNTSLTSCTSLKLKRRVCHLLTHFAMVGSTFRWSWEAGATTSEHPLSFPSVPTQGL